MEAEVNSEMAYSISILISIQFLFVLRVCHKSTRMLWRKRLMLEMKSFSLVSMSWDSTVGTRRKVFNVVSIVAGYELRHLLPDRSASCES